MEGGGRKGQRMRGRQRGAEKDRQTETEKGSEKERQTDKGQRKRGRRTRVREREAEKEAGRQRFAILLIKFSTSRQHHSTDHKIPVLMINFRHRMKADTATFNPAVISVCAISIIISSALDIL